MEITDKKDQKLYDLITTQLDEVTDGSIWYEETEELMKQFDSKGSKWLINPKTKTWFIEVRSELNVFYNINQITIPRLISKEKVDFFDKVLSEWIYKSIDIKTNLMMTAWSIPQIYVVGDVIEKGKPIKSNSLNESSNREEKLLSAVNDYFEEIYLKNSEWFLIDDDTELYLINPTKEEWIFEARRSGALFYNEEMFQDIKRLFNFRDNKIIVSLIENVMKKFPNIEYSAITSIWVDNMKEIQKALRGNKKINNQRWVEGRGLVSDDQSPQT
jgi:hypothetical protein